MPKSEGMKLYRVVTAQEIYASFFSRICTHPNNNRNVKIVLEGSCLSYAREVPGHVPPELPTASYLKFEDKRMSKKEVYKFPGSVTGDTIVTFSSFLYDMIISCKNNWTGRELDKALSQHVFVCSSGRNW